LRAILRGALVDERGFPGRAITLTPEAEACWVQLCDGDARRLLTAVEVAVLSTPPGDDGVIRIDQTVAEESMQQKAVVYGDDGHYDTASAFIKSMRGSDPDAAIYWLAKMITAGEDPLFIARRIVIFASEDVGNADPRALMLAVSAMQGVQMIGMPEARIILAQAVTYCATCPKSNASYMAVDQALGDVREQRVQPVPVHLRDSSHPGAVRAFGHGQGYQYPHDHEGHFVPQEYLTVPTVYYEPTTHGYEARLRERIAYWRRLRAGEEVDAPPDEAQPAHER